MTLLSLLCSLLLSGQVALAEPAEAPPALEVQVAEAVRELNDAREELKQVREALERDLQARNHEIEALRDQLERIEGKTAASDPAPERVSYGRPVIIEADERVREVVAFGDSVFVHGEVLGNATAFGGDVNIVQGARVRGDAVAFGGRVQVAPGAVLDGDQVAFGFSPPTPLQVSTDGHPGLGSTSLVASPELLTTLYRRLIFLLGFAGAGMLMVGLFPRRIGRVARSLEANPVRALLTGGLASGFLLGFGSLTAVLTFGLGLPVLLLVLALLGLAWMLGFVALCQALGDRLPLDRRPQGRWLGFLIGAILLLTLGSIPWIGWLVVGIASIAGIGATLATRFGRR